MPTQAVVRTDMDALKRSNEPSVDTGRATAGGAATLTDTAKEWEVNQWLGQVVEITEGTAKGEFRNIISNTATVLTVAPGWTVVPDNTSWYRIGLAGAGGGGGGPGGGGGHSMGMRSMGPRSMGIRPGSSARMQAGGRAFRGGRTRPAVR